MAKISKSGIAPQQQIKSEHLTRIIDALSGESPNIQIEISGSVTASYFVGNGSLLTNLPTGSSSSSLVTTTFLDSYNGTRLSPLSTLFNGFHISRSVNENIGFSAFNSDDTGNASIAGMTVKGSGPLYTNNTGINHFGANYFIPYLRGNGLLFSDKNLFIEAIGINRDVDIRTGADLGSATSKLKITSNGQLEVAVKPTVNNTAVDLIGRLSDGKLVSVEKSSLSFTDVSISGSGIVNNTSLQELGGVDKLINGLRIGKGGGNIISNTSVGDDALNNNTTGFDNTAIGRKALELNTTGNSNTAVGSNTLQINTEGVQNIAIGTNTLQLNTIGSSNTAVGVNALFSNTEGGQNTAIGISAMSGNTTGNENTATGANTLQLNTEGGQNTAIGNKALQANTIGNFNTAIGSSALNGNINGNHNIAIGVSALLLNTIGNENTAIGNGVLYSNTEGSSNTANGFSALFSNTTGYNNTAIGVSSLGVNSTGYDNTATGRNALQLNTIGYNNTAFGRDALQANTEGENNTGIGNGTLSSNTIGNNNIGIGSLSALGITTGVNNTYIGRGSSIGNTSDTLVLATGITNRIIVDSTGKTNLLGMLNISNVPTFIDNTAATAGGLIVGDVYRTALGVLMIRF